MYFYQITKILDSSDIYIKIVVSRIVYKLEFQEVVIKDIFYTYTIFKYMLKNQCIFGGTGPPE